MNKKMHFSFFFCVVFASARLLSFGHVSEQIPDFEQRDVVRSNSVSHATKLFELLGEKIDSKKFQAWLSSANEQPEIRIIDYRKYTADPRERPLKNYKFKKLGMQLMIDDEGRLSWFQIFGKEKSGFARYNGQLPNGLSFEKSLKEIERKWGPPIGNYGSDGRSPIMARYQPRKEYDVVITYDTTDIRDSKATIAGIAWFWQDPFQTVDIKPAVLLNRVFKAFGGKEKIENATIGNSRVSISIFEEKKEKIKIEIDESFSFPARLRREVKTIADETTTIRTYLVNEKGSWVRDRNGDWVPNLVEQPMHATALSHFNELLTISNSPAELSISKFKTKQGKEYFVVRRDADGEWLSDLIVDSESCLSYCFIQSVELFPGSNVQTKLVTFVKEFAKVGELLVPKTIETYRNGILMSRVKVIELKFSKKIENELFQTD